MMEIQNLFQPSEAFFVIDSEHLDQVREKLYGFVIQDGCIAETLQQLPSGPLTGDGAYVCVRLVDDTVLICQDFIGSYGLYLYQEGDYFALSNSFQYLVEYLKGRRRISFDREFADFLLAADLCSTAYSQTMIRQIRMLDRSAVVRIHIPSATLTIQLTDYQENTIPLDSAEGMALLDRWYRKWTAVLRGIRSRTTNIQVDLTGGFDSRMTISLLLGAGFDPSEITVYSADDNLHTHAEDFRIAGMISDHFGFLLNNYDAASLDKTPNTLEDILNISFYTKLGFHKQMYYSRWKHCTNFYYMGGSGGECIRDYWNVSPEEYIEKAVKRCTSFPAETAKVLKASVRRVLRNSFNQIQEKFTGFGRPLEEKDLAMNLYRETRCRNHFGKDNVEHYYRSSYKLNPLLDPDLHRLRLTDGVCSDANLLMAVILSRFCPDLVTFPFEGGRSIASDTIAHAQLLNSAHPYVPEPIDFHPRAFLAAPMSEDFHRIIELEDVRQNVDQLFRTPAIRRDFTELYGQKAFDSVCGDIQKRSYFALQNAYVIICIGKVLADVRCSENLSSSSLGFWCMDRLREWTANRQQELTLTSHPYLSNYITARVDLKNGPEAGNDILLLDVSDPEAKISRPKWFLTNGSGAILESQKGAMILSLRCVGSGKLSLALRSRDVRNRQNKRIPFWLDILELTIDGEAILSSPRAIWHDAPLKLERPVQDGQILTLSLRWAPHDARNE